MFRLGLVISLVLGTLAGPLVCCCAAGTHAPAAGQAGSKDHPLHAGCCSHRHAEEPASDAGETPAPCRCHDHGNPPAAVQTAGPDLVGLLGVAWTLHAVTPLPSDLRDVGPTPAAGQSLTGGVAFPGLSAREILRALQTLRC